MSTSMWVTPVTVTASGPQEQNGQEPDSLPGLWELRVGLLGPTIPLWLQEAPGVGGQLSSILLQLLLQAWEHSPLSPPLRTLYHPSLG